MKTKALLVSAVWMMMTLAACSDDEPIDSENQGGNDEPNTEAIEGEVEGVWEANSVVMVSGHITVPEGKTLTIEEGVQVIFSDEGVGVNHVPIEFTVDGNLYCEGTAENPILLSVAEDQRTEANKFAGLWGGIVASETCGEMLINHTIIEYTGGQVIEGSPAATAGVYTAGDDAYPQITTNNIKGKYVVTNSIIRNGWSDGIYLMGGQAIIANNIFSANGFDGAEAVNVKAGCQVDVAGNIMFSPNTNGLKLSSSGQSETRGQARIQAYNNTIINSGWRRDGEKGGCIYVEKNALANVFNNLIVNCKFRAMTPSFSIPNNPEEAPLTALSFSGEEITLNRDNTEAGNMTITSKEQAALIFEEGKWYLQDRSEHQTTFVYRADQIELQAGDIIVLGNRRFEFNGQSEQTK